MVRCPCMVGPYGTPELNNGRCVLCGWMLARAPKIEEELAAAWRLGGLRAVYDYAQAQPDNTRYEGAFVAVGLWKRVREFQNEEGLRRGAGLV